MAVTTVDSRSTLCVARQPILNRARRVFGYELLYRESVDALSCTVASNLASSRVLSDSVLALGLDRLTCGKPAFVNFTRPLLLSGATGVLPPDKMVIEVLETVEIDNDVVAACRRLRTDGYGIALDDFVPGSSAEALLPFARFVKVDVLATSSAERTRLAQRLQRMGISLIAEKVESQEVADEVLAKGYSLVQGYYFCRPKTFAAQAMPSSRIAHLRLFAVLSRADLTIDELEDLIKHDVSLSYRVLRSINSAALGVHREVTSVRQALVLLGLDYIRKWASVWALAGLNDGGTPETVAVALLRARCCELLGAKVNGIEKSHGSFLLGLCSLLDVIVGRPMAEVLGDMPLPSDTREALLGHGNRERHLLDAVIAYERGAWASVPTALQPLGLPEKALPDAYAEALAWARELHDSDAAA